MTQPPIIGQPQNTNNPLVVLNGHLADITKVLEQIATPKVVTGYPHDYALAVAEDKGGHGKMWGAYCLACSEKAEHFVYPCQLAPEEAIKPPQFFTIGDVFIIDAIGRMARYEPPGS